MTDAPDQEPVAPEWPFPQSDDQPDDSDLEPNQDLPEEKQPPRGKGNSRGKSDKAPGRKKS